MTAPRTAIDVASRNFQRTEHDVNISIANTLVEILAELQHIRVALAQSADSRSSVEIKTSTRGTDVAVKSYAGSDIEDAESAAVDSYCRTVTEIQERLTNGFAETVKAIAK